MRTQSRISALFSIAAVVVALTTLAPLASAQGGLRASVFVVEGNIPRLPQLSQLLRYARAHQARQFHEITDKPLRDRRWDGTVVISFSRPIGDLEYGILFYDVTGGGEEFISPPMSVMVNSRNESTFVQPIHLPRPRFKPNRDVEIRITVGRQTVGKTKTRLVGEVEQVNNELDFTRADPEHPTR